MLDDDVFDKEALHQLSEDMLELLQVQFNFKYAKIEAENKVRAKGERANVEIEKARIEQMILGVR